MTADKNYIEVKDVKTSVDRFLEYEKLDSIDYVLPGNGIVDLKIQFKDYYQIYQDNTYDILEGTLTSLDLISDNDIISGRMPNNEYEVVIDKLVYDNLTRSGYGDAIYKGITKAEDLLNRKVFAGSLNDITIVGIVDKNAPSIYANKNIFVNLLTSDEILQIGYSGYGGLMNNESSNLADYTLFLDDITLTKGRMPQNDYEVIVNKSNQYQMKLNKTIDQKVNETKLKVVGYYDSKTNKQTYLVNNNTVKYNLITQNTGLMIYPKDKEKALMTLRNNYNINAQDKFETDKKEYIKEQRDSIISGLIFAGVILVISLIEIYLIERSSFLSRIKEVGILRAIGAKRIDIYKMFLGEILAITTIVSMSGVALMTYILSTITKASQFARIYTVNIQTIGVSILLIYTFNIIFGLMPLFKVLRKTPAQILARHDIE